MKRQSPSEPLTPDDVAERLNRAALRTARILMDVRQIDGLADEVKRSRYLTNVLDILRDELDMWGITPSKRAD